MKDPPEERLPWQETTLMRDHPFLRPLCLKIFPSYLLKWRAISFHLIIGILVKRLISRSALSASQWQLHRAILCFCEDPLLSSHVQLWLNDCSFTQHVLKIHQSGYSAFKLLHSWCHVKLLPPPCTFCMHHTNMQQLTVSLYLKPHT